MRRFDDLQSLKFDYFPCFMQDKESNFQNLPGLQSKQESQNRCDSTSDDLEHHTQQIFIDTQSSSTRRLKLAQQDLQLKPVYHLSSKILTHTPITQNMRARLRSFLMTQASKQCILRQTCVLACNLVDLFFAQGGMVEISQFQNLVIGCLILAAKLKEGKFPMISYNIFSRQQLLNYQKKIAKKLNYSLTPYTYYDYAQKAIYLWDYFSSQEGTYNIKLGQCKAGVNYKLRKFYEQLDCIYMVLKSLDYAPQNLVLNHLYLHLITIFNQVNLSTLTQENFQHTYYAQSNQFHQFYKKFLKFYSNKNISLDSSIGIYLRNFLVVTSIQKQWGIKGNAQALEKIRNWDMIQTVPKDNYPLAKSVIQRLNKISQK